MKSRVPLCLCLLTALALTPTTAARGQEVQIDNATDEDPAYEFVEPHRIYHPDLKPLWVRALRRPEAELQRLAADAIARAHTQGMPGLADAAEPLVQRLRDATDAPVRRAVAFALVALDARSAAADLADAAWQGDFAVAQLAEPALARWGYVSAADVWLDRLADPSQPTHWRMLAIQGLGAVGTPRAADPLRSLLEDPRESRQVRLTAARALALIHDQGLTPWATQLAASDEGFERLLGATLMERHTDEDCLALLGELASDADPAVATEALERLFAIDYRLVDPLAAEAAARSDANVRWVAARTYVARRDPEAAVALVPMLNDLNPSLRRFVAARLFEFAAEEALRPAVLDGAEAMLTSGEWRGQEQAALLVGALDHEASAEQLLELLSHGREEVYVAAAWAIRKLEIPEILPELLRIAELRLAQHDRAELDRHEAGVQANQICQTFGQFSYGPAEDYLRGFIPQGGGIGHGRSGAIWALGYYHRDQAPADLTRLLVARLTDIYDIDPEVDYVRRMAALSLGRMKSTAALPDLREFGELEGANTLVGSACYWAIEQITGEPMPRIEPSTMYYEGWFLEPLNQNLSGEPRGSQESVP